MNSFAAFTVEVAENIIEFCDLVMFNFLRTLLGFNDIIICVNAALMHKSFGRKCWLCLVS